MHSQLKSMLLGVLHEKPGGDDQLVARAFAVLGELLLGQGALFKPLPRRLLGWRLPKQELDSSSYNDEEFCFNTFPRKAALLHDSMNATPAGGCRAIYRAKGVRLYLFENGVMELLTPYTTIDKERGVWLENELWDVDVDFTKSIQASDLRPIFRGIYGDVNDLKPRFICQDSIRLLCNIRQPFMRSYLIEYVLTPPDVDVLSDFSRTCASILWDICLSREFEVEVGTQRQSQCIEVLSQCAGAPAASRLLAYLREASTWGGREFTEILARIDQLEQGLTGKLDGISTQLLDPAYWSSLFRPSPDIKLSYGGRQLSLRDVKALVTTMLEEFKSLVENQGLWKELWDENDQPRWEQSAQRLFYAMASSYCKANNLDITPEANNGVGPVDFKFSSGFHARFLVEVKLSTNVALVHGYTTQLEAYKAAESTDEGVLLVVDVGGLGGKLDAVRAAQLAVQKENIKASEVFYVDGQRQQSASVRADNPRKKSGWPPSNSV